MIGDNSFAYQKPIFVQRNSMLTYPHLFLYLHVLCSVPVFALTLMRVGIDVGSQLDNFHHKSGKKGPSPSSEG